jgi:hypothetical protein
MTILSIACLIMRNQVIRAAAEQAILFFRIRCETGLQAFGNPGFFLFNQGNHYVSASYWGGMDGVSKDSCSHIYAMLRDATQPL